MARQRELCTTEIPRFETLSPVQKFALDIVYSVGERGRVTFPPDFAMDLVQGIPSDHLTYPVLMMGAEYALVTDFRTKGDGDELVRITTPEGKWLAIQKEFCTQVVNCRGPRALILKPFFAALWAGDKEAAKLRMGKKYGLPEYFFADRNEHTPAKHIHEAWYELFHLGIIERVWDIGEEQCHYELNPTFFAAFKNGWPDGFDSPEDMAAYARSYFKDASLDK